MDQAGNIRVSALFRLRLAADLEAFRPTHVVSLVDPTLPDSMLPRLPSGTASILSRFFDGDSPTSHPPDRSALEMLVEFTGGWARQRQSGIPARLLVHCHMGASRSTAMACIALSQVHGPDAAMDSLLEITNKPWPNLLMVQLADDILSYGGRLVTSLEAYRIRYPRRIAAYRRLNARRGLL